MKNPPRTVVPAPSNATNDFVNSPASTANNFGAPKCSQIVALEIRKIDKEELPSSQDWQKLRSKGITITQYFFENTKEVLRFVSPGALSAIFSVMIFAFLLEARPGNTLISGFLLYGRTEVNSLSCEEFERKTTCIQESVLGMGMDQEKDDGLTELGESVDPHMIKSVYPFYYIGMAMYSMSFINLMYSKHCRKRDMVCQGLVHFVWLCAAMVAWYVGAPRADFRIKVTSMESLWSIFLWTNPYGWVFYNAVLTFIILFVLHFRCPRHRRIFKSSSEVAIFLSVFGLEVAVTSGTAFGSQVLAQAQVDPAFVVISITAVISLSNAFMMFLLRCIPNLPLEASSSFLIVTKLVCLSVQKSYVASLDSIDLVMYAAGLQAIFDSFGRLILLSVKNIIWEPLRRNGDTEQYMKRRFLQIVDVLVDTVSQLTATFVDLASQTATDISIFDSFGGTAPCKSDLSLSRSASIFAILITFEALSSAFAIWISLFMLGPFEFQFVTRSSSFPSLAMTTAGIFLLSQTLFLSMNTREACLYCELQALGEPCD